MKLWQGLNKLPRELWILSIATLINRSGSMVLPFLAIYANKHLKFTIAEAGLILTVYGVAALITTPIVGKICDWLNPFKVMKISLVFSGLLLFLFPFAVKYYEILVLTFIWSILNEAFRPANLVLISSFSTLDQRRLAFGLNRLAINLGMSIGPAVGGFLVLYNYSLIFYVDGTAHILSWLFLLTGAMNIKMSTLDAIESDANSNNAELILRNRRRMYLFILAFIPVALVFFQILSTFPIYLTQELKFAESTYGLIFTLNTVMIIFIEVPLLNYLSRHSNLRLMSVGSLLVAFGFGAILFAKSLPLILATVVIWTFGEMIIFPSSAAYVSEIAPMNKRGQFMGFYQTANNIAFTLGPWLGTLIYEKCGSTVLWIGTFFLGIISFAGIKKLEVSQKEKENKVQKVNI